MGKIIVPIDMPETCGECLFCGDIQELSVDKGLYKKIARCKLAPNDIEDPWRDIYWQSHNKENWCPLIAYKG